MSQTNLFTIQNTILNQNPLDSNNIKLNSNTILFFEQGHNSALNSYIKEHLKTLKTQYKSNGFHFIFLPEVLLNTEDTMEVLSYFAPALGHTSFLEPLKKEILDFKQRQLDDFLSKGISRIFENAFPTQLVYTEILHLLGYEGTAKAGFLYIDYQSLVFQISEEITPRDYPSLFQDVLQKLVKHQEEQWEGVDFSFSSSDYFATDLLDDETQAIVMDFENKLSELKDSGQMLFLVPILKNIIDKHATLDHSSLSVLEITPSFELVLPLFNKKVTLSHLTKAIYLLFLKYPEGIHLNELVLYKTELLKLYTSISNLNNYDKMKQSVEDVINIETKAIYTHFSRIKAAFYKIMDKKFAGEYIISGSGIERRSIKLSPNAIHWKSL